MTTGAVGGIGASRPRLVGAGYLDSAGGGPPCRETAGVGYGQMSEEGIFTEMILGIPTRRSGSYNTTVSNRP